MAVIYLALGSNVGNTKNHLQETVKYLGEKISEIKVAPIYETKPVGYTKQANFLNTAVKGITKLSPDELLNFTQATEKKAGRIKRFRWGPREIDIDIIFYEHEIISEEGLKIPHPRFMERDFVLKPLSDLSPNLIDPLSKLTVKKLLDNLPIENNSIIKRFN